MFTIGYGDIQSDGLSRISRNAALLEEIVIMWLSTAILATAVAVLANQALSRHDKRIDESVGVHTINKTLAARADRVKKSRMRPRKVADMFGTRMREVIAVERRRRHAQVCQGLALLPAPLAPRAPSPRRALFMYAVSQAGYTMVELALILGIGTVAMHFIEDDWSLRVSLYWAVETTTTVGYGDVVPTCTAGRAFFIFYAVVSTIIFARVRAQTLLSSRSRP